MMGTLPRVSCLLSTNDDGNLLTLRALKWGVMGSHRESYRGSNPSVPKGKLFRDK